MTEEQIAQAAERQRTAIAIARNYPITSRDAFELLRECEWDEAQARRALDAGLLAGGIRLMRELLERR